MDEVVCSPCDRFPQGAQQVRRNGFYPWPRDALRRHTTERRHTEAMVVRRRQSVGAAGRSTRDGNVVLYSVATTTKDNEQRAYSGADNKPVYLSCSTPLRSHGSRLHLYLVDRSDAVVVRQFASDHSALLTVSQACRPLVCVVSNIHHGAVPIAAL